MELPEIDALDAELLETALGLPNEVLGMSVGHPASWPRPSESSLGGDQESFIGVERFADQVLGDVRAVAIGRVDEVDADLGKPAQRGQRCLTIGRRSPDAGPRDAHGAIAKTMDRDITNLELAGGAGVYGAHVERRLPRHPPRQRRGGLASNTRPIRRRTRGRVVQSADGRDAPRS